jgi:basic membrane protein A and related proteins
VKKRLLPWIVMAPAAIALIAAAGTPAKTDARGAAAQTFRAGLVTDIGGLNDRSFNFLANQGRLRAQKDLKVGTRVFISRGPQDYIPNLQTSARQNGLTIGVGFLMAESINTVAKAFPDSKFAIVDFGWEGLKDKPTNVRGLLFKEQEAGYLVGYLAGLTLKRTPFRGQRVAGAVGGVKIPPVDRFIAGYRAGVRKAEPRARVVVGYSQDFVDQAKCKEQALGQIGQGAGIIFAVAGQCGLGALDAAKQNRAWGIGVDADQLYLGSHMLTSAVKKVDVAVFETIRAAQRTGERFRGGYNTTFSVKNNGVGIGKISSRVPRADRNAVEAIRKQIAAGKIRIPDKV